MVQPITVDSARPVALIAIGVTVAYAVTARLGFQVAFVAEQVTTVWAPTGIALAALLLWGRRLWPAIWVGAFIANATTTAPLWTAAVIATGNTLEAVVAAWLLRKNRSFDPNLGRIEDVARLILAGAGLAAVISATIGVTTLCVAGVQPWSRIQDLWTAWWLGDALGALVIAPVILTTVSAFRRQNWQNVILLMLASMAVTQGVFGRALGMPLGEGLLHYLVFPLVVVAAVQFGQPSTSLVVLGVSAVSIWSTLRGVGPFASPGIYRGLIQLQAFMAVLAGTGLMLAAAMAERLAGQRRRGATSGISDVLAEAEDLVTAAPAILRQVCQNLEWQFGALWLVDAEARKLRCHAVWNGIGPRADAFEQAIRQMQLAQGVSLPGRVWASGRPAWVEDVVKDPNCPRARAAREAGVHGAFGVPISIDDDVVGVVEFFTPDVAPVDDDLLATMSPVGSQLGQFVARSVEKAIAREQQRPRAILDSAPDAVIDMDQLGVITEFNPAAERAFGYRKAEALGRVFADLIIAPDSRERRRGGIPGDSATGLGLFLNRRVETRGFHADGHEFPIEVAITVAADGGPPRFTGFVRDLSEQEEVEDAVHSSEERFRTLAASNGALTFYEQDRDLRYRWVFPEHREFPASDIGKTDDELFPRGEGERLTALKRRVLETGKGGREEVTVTLKTGVRSYDLMVEPRRDEKGSIVGVCGVAVDITDRQRTEQLLRHSEARLIEADRHKDEFLAMLAHELRNPLAPIRTGLELVRVSGDTPEAVARIRQMMERQIGHMVRLIDDLLDVSRISSGKIQVHRQPTSLTDIVFGAVEANRAAMDDAAIRLDVKLPGTPLLLLVDQTRFVQVVSNLLNNATKFTDAGGSIVLHGEVVPDGTGAPELVLSVTDTGIGISSEMLPRVFDLFTSGQHTSQRGQTGLGIGLALARRIVEMHGGRIAARSAGPGTGSQFTIRMPILVSVPERSSEERPKLDGRATAKRVLIVDDNADAVEMLASLVGAMGGEVETADNGLAAIQRAATFKPDVIILDIGMPVMDGYEACRRIRQKPFGRGVLIVALTGWGQESDKQRAVEAGFDAHLIKPVDPKELERLLARGGRN